MKRLHAWAILGILAMLCGCSSWFSGKSARSQSPDETEESTKIKRLVGDLVVPFGLYPVKVESVALVTGLRGTGSDPAPSAQRTLILDEMRARGVKNPAALLATKDASVVLVQAVMRAGIQKGDRVDLEIRVPSQSDTTSLRGGYMLQTRLREMGVLGGQVHEGRVVGLAEGPVLVDPSADPKKNRIMSTRGRILGGGVALQSRPLELVLLPGQRNVMNSSRVANAVNRRFHTYENGDKVGVANAQTDQYIVLKVHPRYKDNLNRYVEVIRSIALNEKSADQMDRINRLSKMILDPETACEAALQLEALNQDGIPPLLKALDSKMPEVRFYAAEALAYLDRHEAVLPLSEAARNQPAFRVYALTALSAMQDPTAFDELKGMLSLPSAETRYGAFRSLWTMNPNDSFVKGEIFNDEFHYHVLDVAGPDMIHVTRSRLAEVVLFGKDQKFNTPLTLCAGNHIIVKSNDEGEVTVSKFTVDEPDQKRFVSSKIDDVIRAIVELGGTYPDVVQALQEAKSSGVLTTRFEVDTLPEAGRIFDPKSQEEGGEALATNQNSSKVAKPSSPTPELFSTKDSAINYKEGKKSKKSDSTDDVSEEKKEPKKAFFGKMWTSDSSKEKSKKTSDETEI